MVFQPPTHHILIPLPMIYRPHYPWYFDPLHMVYLPPTDGILTPLPMIFRPRYPCYIDLLPMVYSPLPMVF
jgi:hypothetical protein